MNNFYKGKKVSVTGGSGFIGSHTADELTRNKYQVKIFDKHKFGVKRSV